MKAACGCAAVALVQLSKRESVWNEFQCNNPDHWEPNCQVKNLAWPKPNKALSFRAARIYAAQFDKFVVKRGEPSDKLHELAAAFMWECHPSVV